MGLLLALLVAPLLTFAQATLSISNFSITQGETKEVLIELDNTVEIRALQVRIVLPDSIIMAARPELVAERIGGSMDDFGEWMPSTKSLSYNHWDDGSHMIMVNSDDGIPFSGTEGGVIRLKLTAAEDALPGDYNIEVKDVELVYSDGVDYIRQEDISCPVMIVTRKYQITYLLDGSIYGIDSIVPGEKLIPEEYPVKEGHTFSGWMGLPETMPSHDVTVTGSFAVNEYAITYTVDGEVFHTDSIAYGTALTAIAAPVKEGYTFSGWMGLPDTMPAKDVTVTGSFVTNGYTLTYVIDGEVYKTILYEYNAVVIAEASPVKEGHTFHGWIGLPETMPAKDVTVIGSFTVNKYLVTFKIGDEVIVSDSLEYGSTIVAPDAPEKEGHTFDGWGEVAERVSAKDLTYDGSYSVNSYLLTYTVDGEVFHTDSIAYGTALIAIAAPVKEGYTFSGWIGLPESMPAEDVTITGSFILNATQTDEQGLVYTLNESRDAFEVVGYAALTVQDVVIPAALYELPVTSVKDKALMGADAVNSVVIPASVDKVGEKAFYGCSNLLAVEWNATAPLSANVFDKPSNHGNMLVHVADAATMIGYQGNVVVAGLAERITLIDDMPLRNTNRFIARHITFDHTFAKRTKIGVSGGWEALVLPFDVQRVVSETKGELKPFGEADFETSLPYWLGELQEDGTFAAVQEITANKPFIMQLPNSDEYEDIYNVDGKVTFSAEDATVHVTTDVEQEKSTGYSLQGSYEGTAADSYVYALNDEEYTADSEVYMPGGVFVANSRDIRPFEAYVYSSQVAPAPYLRISGKGTNGIDHSTLNTQPSTIYDLMGRKVLKSEVLKKGIYILNGKLKIEN